ncbi:MAG: hypothetical protein AAF799_25625 [Myxococcota bacterium]
MPIQTDNNPEYRGPKGFNKYSPLKKLQLAAGDSAHYDALVSSRETLLKAPAIFPAELLLVMPDWDAAVNQENAHGGNRPPLVVVSSNRADWILAGFNRATAVLHALGGGLTHFNNINDVRALLGPTPDPQSPPVYCPLRLGPAPRRSVYIIVHAAEYDYYKTKLSGTGVTIVGWQFKQPTTGPVGTNPFSGFGASRFAAIEFLKTLRNKAHAAGGAYPWGKAWLFDDNVIGFRLFAGLTAVETAMGATDVCAGFNGLIQPNTRDENRKWANGQPPNKKDGTNLPALKASRPPGLVQQASLWNIDYIEAQNVNFSPIFVASKEDVSLTQYFNTKPITYQWYAIDIFKEPAGYDNSPGAGIVNTARQAFTNYFSTPEDSVSLDAPSAPATTANPTPPRTTQTLRHFVDNVVLPGSVNVDATQAANADIQRLAVCHSIESVLTSAVKGDFPPPAKAAPYASYLAPASVSEMFNPPGGATVTVTARDVS